MKKTKPVDGLNFDYSYSFYPFFSELCKPFWVTPKRLAF